MRSVEEIDQDIQEMKADAAARSEEFKYTDGQDRFYWITSPKAHRRLDQQNAPTEMEFLGEMIPVIHTSAPVDADWECDFCSATIEVEMALRGPASDGEMPDMSGKLVHIPVPVPLFNDNALCKDCAEKYRPGMAALGDRGKDLPTRMILWASESLESGESGVVVCPCAACRDDTIPVLLSHKLWQSAQDLGEGW